MKRFLLLSLSIMIMLTANQVFAQDKVKVKDDKTKVKEEDGKLKDKEDKIKMKDETGKTKVKDDKTKIKDADGKVKIKNDGMDYPYKAGYSSNFVMGNPKHAKMILDMWKDYDDNNFTRHDYLADTIKVFLADGSVISGKQNALSGISAYRSTFTAVSSTVDAWMPLKSVDRNENWVAIWGTENDTNKDGSVTSAEIHEIWRINKDGKIDYMKQYAAKTPAAQ